MMMAQAKRIYILIVKVNKLFSFFSSRCFLKEIENMFFVFLPSYRNARESLGELEGRERCFVGYIPEAVPDSSMWKLHAFCKY